MNIVSTCEGEDAERNRHHARQQSLVLRVIKMLDKVAERRRYDFIAGEFEYRWIVESREFIALAWPVIGGRERTGVDGCDALLVSVLERRVRSRYQASFSSELDETFTLQPLKRFGAVGRLFGIGNGAVVTPERLGVLLEPVVGMRDG